MDLLLGVFSAFGLSASAGLNAYIPLLVISLVGRYTNWITLSEPWNTLENGWVIAFLLLLSAIEFFADKVPAVNHANDLIQTLVRPAAGAIAFAANADIITDANVVFSLILGLLVAGGVHATKSVIVRPAVTATTGGAGNIPISILEDVVSTFLSILSVLIPVIVAVILIMVAAWVIWLLWRRANRLARS
ncbi:MAG TPA: DUF4126 domain-containing protein [Anaerolineales bacterium]|nr:DUF4126 domain-containing protein [Anaerolineales bacterium]